MYKRAPRRETDQEPMLALARSLGEHHLHVVDLPYRLSSWSLDEPDNSALWFDAQGTLPAWAVMQTPFWTIDYVCSPYHDDLHREILAWADDRAQRTSHLPNGRPAWYVNVFAEQATRIQDLEAAGFTCQSNAGQDSWSTVLMRRSIQTPLLDAHDPTGFTFRPLAGEAEVEAYVHLHQDVFESRNMTVGWRRRTLFHPRHSPDLDWVAVGSDGRLAGFCIGWLSVDGNGQSIGQIEPMGIRKDVRQLGLGRAILVKVLRRMHEKGASTIVVETDRQRNAALALYESVGFRVEKQVLVFRKDYGVVAAKRT